jgi:hypothetical protein
MNSDFEITNIIDDLAKLTPEQRKIIISTIQAFNKKHDYWCNPESDIVNQGFLKNFGNELLAYHVLSKQALAKDRFEFAFEKSLNESGFNAKLAESRTNRGHDITVNGVPFSLKTEAAKNIVLDKIHISKWMELGKGEWELNKLLSLFLEHMTNYDRIFMLRCLNKTEEKFEYELVEIPKNLLLESKSCSLEIQTKSKQSPQPGYGYVYDENENLKFSLYFDGGSERKLQIKKIRKDLCIIHARWIIELSSI